MKQTTKPLEIIHSDMCGPMTTTTLGGAKYIMTFFYDLSWRMSFYVMKFKGEYLERFKEFKVLVKM